LHSPSSVRSRVISEAIVNCVWRCIGWGVEVEDDDAAEVVDGIQLHSIGVGDGTTANGDTDGMADQSVTARRDGEDEDEDASWGCSSTDGDVGVITRVRI